MTRVVSIRAMTTPLASIFGSGFLVIVPILAGAVGPHAGLAMLVVGAVAILVGSIVRHNILCAEPAIEKRSNRIAVTFERLSGFALVGAYVVSVCLYLHILSAFVLGGVGLDSASNRSLLTSGLILVITVTGLAGGLGPLERMERWALYGTFVVLVAMIAGFALYDLNAAWSATGLTLPTSPDRSAWEVARIVAGTLIVVQGFETPRYLGGEFDRWTRIRASRWSQYLSTATYVVFVALAVPIVPVLAGEYHSGSLVVLARAASVLLPGPLIVAAAMSQFSAAVADTVAAGANLEEVTRSRISNKVGYLGVGAAAIILAWTGSPLETVALASRAFAFYYLIQCVVAFSVCRNHRQRARFVLTGLILSFVLIFAIPEG